MDISEAVIRILFAAFLGGLIGVEREYRDKSAGFRTMIMIAVGSAVFTVIAFSITEQLTTPDPTRIISYIISGIGFLGAGVIIKDGMSVRGLTTASMIWLSAALGMGSGAGLFAISAYTALLTLFVLVVLPPIEAWIDSKHSFRIYEIEVKTKADLAKVADLFGAAPVDVFKSRRLFKEGSYWLSLHANGSIPAHEDLTTQLLDLPYVLSSK